MTADPVTGLIAATELTKEARSLVGRMFGPAADVIGEVLASKVRNYFTRNRDAVINRAAEMVTSVGEEPRTVPLRVMVPILEGAAREDDARMQERWAALLANASLSSDADGVPPVFAEILGNLTPAAARALEQLGHTVPRRGDANYTSREAGGTTVSDLAYQLQEVEPQTAEEAIANEERVWPLLDLLVREGLATQTPVVGTSGDRFRGDPPPLRLEGMDVRITHLGLQFLRACAAPTSASEDDES